MTTQPDKTLVEPIYVRWPVNPDVQANWGDKLNPTLCARLSGRPVIKPVTRAQRAITPIYSVIGSNLRSAEDNYIVWGSGIMTQDGVVAGKPDIRAVRGPLSRRRVLELGHACPDIIGDPAVLYALFYRPVVTPAFDIGVIRHFREADIPGPVLPPTVSVRDIDITASLETVVDEILSCRAILSSSLHGSIAAHAYGVPAAWIRLSDRPLGDGTKFRDYFASVGHDDVQPFDVQPGGDHHALMDLPVLPVRPFDAAALLRACPFADPARLQAWLDDCHLIWRRPGAPAA